MLKRLITLIFIVSTASANSQTIYQCPTEDGSIVFTDQKCHHGSTFPLKDQNIAIPTLRNPLGDSVVNIESDRIDYLVEITSPTQEQTITPGEQTVSITVAVSPTPPGGSLYQLIVNGNKVSKTPSSQFILSDLIRGQYDLVIEVLNPAGELIAQSAVRTIYVHRPSIQQGRATTSLASGLSSLK